VVEDRCGYYDDLLERGREMTLSAQLLRAFGPEQAVLLTYVLMKAHVLEDKDAFVPAVPRHVWAYTGVTALRQEDGWGSLGRMGVIPVRETEDGRRVLVAVDRLDALLGGRGRCPGDGCVNGPQLHGLVHVAEQLGEEEFVELLVRAPPEYWALIRRLALLSGQVEKQIEPGADPQRVLAPAKVTAVQLRTRRGRIELILPPLGQRHP
jgi:hypothetical protein